MRKLIEEIYCEFSKSLHPDFVRATHENITIDIGDGPREADLCDSCFDELVKPLGPLLAIMRRVKRPHQKTANHDRRPNDYYPRLRAWAKTQGIEIKQNGDGKYEYPPGVKTQYDKHLEGQV